MVKNLFSRLPLSRNKLQRMFLYSLVVIALCIICFPLFWMVSTSLMSSSELAALDTIVPTNPTFVHYLFLIGKTNFLQYYANSLLVTLSAIIFTIPIATLGGYSIGRLKFRGKDIFRTLILFVYMFPSSLLFIPLFVIIQNIGLMDTYYALIITYVGINLPFTLWLLSGFFSTMPKDYEEAAQVDGCSRVQAIYKIALPLALPGVISATIFSFLISFNEYLYALVFIHTESRKTLPLGMSLWSELSFSSVSWGALMAACVLITIPMLVFFMWLYRYLIAGMGTGGVKA